MFHFFAEASRRRLRAAVWLALCAMLLAGFAPVVSRLLQAGATPVCHMADGGASRHGALHLAAQSLDACGYCSMQADLPVLPPLPPRCDTPTLLVRFAVPFIFLAPQPQRIWLMARSRAPPAI